MLRGTLIAHAREHRTNQLEAAVDVPADKELLRPASLELDSVGLTGSCGCAQVGVGSLGRPAGVGERVGESFLPRMGSG